MLDIMHQLLDNYQTLSAFMLLTCTGSCRHNVFELAARLMTGIPASEEEHLPDALIRYC